MALLSSFIEPLLSSDSGHLHRYNFPKDFVFEAATSAYQPQMLPLANPLSIQIVDMEFVLHGESVWLYLVSVLEVPSTCTWVQNSVDMEFTLTGVYL
ncbi:unnamed protein product [Calypogeia fissa]